MEESVASCGESSHHDQYKESQDVDLDGSHHSHANYGINNDSLNLLTIDLQEHNRIREISNQALFGLIIAIFAHLHLFITPFWFIFIFMYFNILTPIH